MRIGFYLAWPFLISPEAGADTIVYLASSRAVDGATGGYFIERRPATPNRLASDEGVARRLWEVSEALTGEHRPEQ